MAFLDQFGLKQLLMGIRTWVVVKLSQFETTTRRIVEDSLERELAYENRSITYTTNNNTIVKIITNRYPISSSYNEDGGEIVYDRAVAVVDDFPLNTVSLNVPVCVHTLKGSTHYLEEIYGGHFQSTDNLPTFTGNNTIKVITSEIERFEVEAFKDCVNLQSMSFSKTVAIKDRAFENCTSLSYISLSEPTVTLGTNSFSNCGTLNYVNLVCEEIYIPMTGSFNNTIIDFLSCYSEIRGEMATTINHCVLHCDKVHNYVFNGCSIKDLEAPLLKFCGQASFKHNDLTEIELPSIEILEDRAFENNNNLTKVTLGKNLKRMGGNCFQGCHNLKEVYILSEYPPTPSGNLFSYAEFAFPIYVPRTSVQAYKDHNKWGIYNIQGYDFPEEESLE